VLVGFAAVSIVTSAVSGLTGAFVVPADASIAPAPQTVAAAGITSDGPVSGASNVTATSTLGRLAGVSASALPAYLTGHHAEIDKLIADPPAATDVSRVWSILDAKQQAVLLKEAPHLIGNLEGVPYTVRGRANALDLKRTIATAKTDLKTERGKTQRLVLQRQLTTLGNVKDALEKKDGVTRTLVSLDTSSDAKAAIVVGDLSTAKYVSVLVPGMYMSVGEQIEAWAEVAQDLHDQEAGFLKRIGGQTSGSTTPGVAVVAWIGYQTPVLTNIGGLALAQQGADSLERTLEGITSLRAADPPYLSVFAHSYGSTAALLALERGNVQVDALALMGSPGSDAQSVKDLSVRGGNVWVGEAPMDPIVDSAFFGSDPGSPSYGAKKMGVSGAVDPLTHRALAGSSGHNEYFTAGTECMRNLAMIGIDQGRLVL